MPIQAFDFIEFVNASGVGGYLVPAEIVTEEYRAGLKEMGYEERLETSPPSSIPPDPNR